jgi:hypothetical protein
MEEEREDTVRDMSMQADGAGRTSGTEIQHGGRDHSAWLERPTSDRTQEYGQTMREDLEDPVAPIRFLHAQQQLYNRMPEQVPPNALAYGQPGHPSTSSVPHTDYRQTIQQQQSFNQQTHHVPSGISLSIDDGGMFNNVDLILQAASERLTDPGSGGEGNPTLEVHQNTELIPETLQFQAILLHPVSSADNPRQAASNSTSNRPWTAY